VNEFQTIIQALSDPSRFALFDCIRGCGGATSYDETTGLCDAGDPEAVCICDVKCQVPCAPSTLTHHLNALRSAGLITTEKRGRNLYATVVPEKLERFARYFGTANLPCESCGRAAEVSLAH